MTVKSIEMNKIKSFRKKVLTAMLFFTIAGLCSCKKYLEEKSDNSQVVPSTLQDVQALLDNDQIINRSGGFAFMEASADDYFLLSAAYASNSHLQQMYTWRPYYYTFSNDWSSYYNAIYYANLNLEVLDNIPVTAANQVQWRNLKGSALFIRAYNFLQLTWAFSKAYDESSSSSDLGIVLKLESDFNKPMARASAKQSYDQVINDVKESILLLPDFPQLTTRPSKVAAYGLLARTYLSMRQYDSAFKYSDLSLQLNNQLMNYGSSSFPDFKSNPEVIYYHSFIPTSSSISTSIAFIDTLLYLSYSTDDWRRSAFFLAGPTSPTGLVYQRFKGSYTNNTSTFFSGIATDEMFFTRAECYARAGNKDAALSDLNKVLQTRWKAGFVPINTTTAAQALEVILIERRKELLMRGLRWIDIKRLNKEGRNIVLTRNIDGTIYTLSPNANYYALPLPGDIIEISGMPQNPN